MTSDRFRFAYGLSERVEGAKLHRIARRANGIARTIYEAKLIAKEKSWGMKSKYLCSTANWYVWQEVP